jgi:4-alpha-glucanotransferase
VASRVQLLLVIHNHQPVGNFDHVIHEACDSAYLPFLRAMLEAPHIRFGLHTSGCLLEWLEQHRLEYFELVRELLSRGQIELLGGGMYEPILPVLTRTQALRQVRTLHDYLERHFGVNASGIWCPERVWEPHLPSYLPDSVRYTLLDDFHFIGHAPETQIEREYFSTDHAGRELALLPISKTLRYTIPFQSAEATIGHLQELMERGERTPLCVFGDDGEKFGVWPETHEWVYKRGWLQSFVDALQDCGDWLDILLPGEMLATRLPAGRVYIPCRSYKEMGEWARLDPDASEDDPPGHWRNYFVKYPESASMYERMTQISAAFDGLGTGEVPGLAEAQAELMRGQCNCPYWHGVFGGLYLNYLRAANTHAMLRAQRWLDESGLPEPEPLARERRLARVELRDPARLTASFDGGRGLALTRLDDLRGAFCWTDVLARRKEHYHHKLIELAERGEAQVGDEHASIHDRVVVKEEGLAERLVSDPHQRASFVSYFSDVADPEWFMRVPDPDMSQPRFALRDFEIPCKAVDAGGEIGGYIDHPGFVLHKMAALREGELHFCLRSLRSDAPTGRGLFWVEFNLTVLTCNADDRYMLVDSVQAALDAPLSFDTAQTIALVDEWQRRRAVLTCESGSALLFTYPVFTVSSSEGGFERTYQGTCIMLGYEPGALREGIRLRLGIEELG